MDVAYEIVETGLDAASKYRHDVNQLTSLACLIAISFASCRTSAGSQIATTLEGARRGQISGKVAVVKGIGRGIAKAPAGEIVRATSGVVVPA